MAAPSSDGLQGLRREDLVDSGPDKRRLCCDFGGGGPNIHNEGLFRQAQFVGGYGREALAVDQCSSLRVATGVAGGECCWRGRERGGMESEIRG